MPSIQSSPAPALIELVYNVVAGKAHQHVAGIIAIDDIIKIGSGDILYRNQSVAIELRRVSVPLTVPHVQSNASGKPFVGSGVVAIAAIQIVPHSATIGIDDDRVIAVACMDCVCAIATDQDVIARTTYKEIVAGAASQIRVAGAV